MKRKEGAGGSGICAAGSGGSAGAGGRSVDVHRRHVILPRERKGDAAVAHQRETLAIRSVNRIKRVEITRLLANILGQGVDGHRAHIDDTLRKGFATLEIYSVFIETSSGFRDLDGLHHGLWDRADQIHMRQPVLQMGPAHLDPLG